MAESSDIPVSDNFQPAPGVDYGEDTPTAPVEPTEALIVDAPAEPTADKKPEETVNPPVDPVEPVTERPKKTGAIATLLEKKHEAEALNQELAAKNAELTAKLADAANQPTAATTDDAIKSLVEEYGFDEDVLNKLATAIRKGITPAIPDELNQLLQERQVEKQQQAELTAFNKRVDSLSKVLPNEALTDPKVREKLMDLAYSTEKAPDGEPYFQKELSELYFGFIKPEIEPGTPSAETSQGGNKSGAIVDFEDIYTRDNPKDITDMDSETFTKYNTWVRENKEKLSPIKRS